MLYSMAENIPAYVINLKRRPDRLEAIREEFKDRKEFSLKVIEAVEHEVGAIGLWESFLHILKIADDDSDFVLICEDDHFFTEDYSLERLLDCIDTGRKTGADVLVGGASWCLSALRIGESNYWVEDFTGTQFVIVFRKFIPSLLEATFTRANTLDRKMAALSQNVQLIYPFVSSQRDFGYSDATADNHGTNKVEGYFETCAETIKLLNVVSTHLKSDSGESEEISDVERLTIPTYVINLPERTERRQHILKEFHGRSEFDVTIVEAVKKDIGALGLWLSIRNIIQGALEQDHDVIVICEDDHEFTAHYSADSFIKSIYRAYALHADFLIGGTGHFKYALPFSPFLSWVSHVQSTQFIVVYRKFYEAILHEPFDDTVVADLFLSDMTSNKYLFYPFISRQRDFGYSDVTAVHQDSPGTVSRMFERSDRRLAKIQEAYVRFQQ
jgi:GR25 family glycosyltransferase involved in LPS biosynthesis